ncbi:MAG: response regulator transcription factor [Lachnospiraceae bacterium]|nr:response regulator transcription factor [Lachnospiraceae bacterium]
MYRIMVCDDEKDIVNALRIYLEQASYEVVTASNGKEAIDLLDENIDLIILDVMMPVMDGIEAMKKIRETSNVPIILLTAKSEEIDKVTGLYEGADDYVTKPFASAELLARVRSQLRRYRTLGGQTKEDYKLQIGGIELDDRAKEVTLDGEKVALTPIEYDILKLLMEHPGKVYAPKEIYEAVWQDATIGAESTVAVHIRHLREKLEYDSANPRYLKAVWGRGYKIED